ncbi:MAG: dual specificity protein phosphatase family protein [Planctomycetota bacterium]|nr:dual specificity protein phosphatase family protein [Planctomycetota bacterium]
MMGQRSRIHFLWLSLFLAAGCGVTEVVDREPNGDPIIIRSPQPNSDDLKTLHQRFGVRTVLNLRGQKPGRSWYEDEKDGVERIGAKWVHMAVDSARRPSSEMVREFFQLVEEPANWPILLHCQGGIHRSGLMTALYRMQYQGWTAEDAIAEMDDRYFEWGIRDRSALKEYLRQYKRDPNRALRPKPTDSTSRPFVKAQ